jgi:Ti-type conjugative transfer relaxase TraA
MAIYHFSAKVISRSCGSNAVASAAYRSAERLPDQRLDRTHDFTNKSGVVHSEVMLPEGAPERLGDRSTLWNEVEAGEARKDAQLSREVEFAIPRELNQQQGIDLARDFVREEFVDRGMIADLNVHWDVGADGLAKPHAHVMLTMREVSEDGFGAKVRDWNKSELVQEWRERWAEHVNERLASLDIDARIDHRSLADQGIDLEPQNKIGPAASRMAGHGLEAERIADHAEIARRNGEKIIAQPGIALDAITRQQATFTRRDLAMFIHRHSDGKDQFDHALSAVQSSSDIIELGRDGRGDERFTSREMIEVEARLARATELMAKREHHCVSDGDRERALSRAEERGLSLSGEQRDAFDHATSPKDLGIVVGYAGTGKSAMLGVAREAWEESGYQVRGLALSGIAAENLEAGSAIPSRTIASLEHQWGQGRELPTARDVLVIDEAGMVGSRQMERVLSHAHDAGAKVVLVGDPEQLQAIEAGAAFRSIAERHGGVEITEIRRQQEDWQRDATRQLATERTAEALRAYHEHDRVHAADTREQARGELIDTWDRERIAYPDKSRMILTHTNDEVRDLNELARGKLRDAGELGEDVTINTERGDRSFAPGDRLIFLRNDRDLGVKNGTLGEIERANPHSMTVKLDDGRSIAFDTKNYADIDHGYAATIHKSQGITVDRTHVLATPGLDRHATYVALSRHREGVQVHYGRDDFAGAGKLARSLSRERDKDMASDYPREREVDPARQFAARREIRSPIIRLPEPPQRQIEPQKVRSIFAGIKLDTPQPERQSGIFANLRLPAVPLEPAKTITHDRDTLQRQVVQRHARAVDDIFKMRDRGLPTLPHQTSALHKARAALDELGKRASKDMEHAYKDDPSLAHEAADGRTQRAIRAMKLEAEIRINPSLRADRFVQNWQHLDGQRRDAYTRGDHPAMHRVREHMGAMADGLHRDPQLESVLAGRKRDLGISIGFDRGQSIGSELMNTIGLGRGRGLGL